MRGIDVDKLNDTITSEDGKIRWAWCKGYTSELIKKLMARGWYVTNNHGINTLHRPNGSEVFWTIGWCNLLAKTACQFEAGELE